jgi:translation initiation factor eIF-2B subunit beta
METTLLIKYIVTNAKFATIHELIAIIKAAGRRLVEAQPKGNPNRLSRCSHSLIFEEHTVGNIVRRILRLIREEWAAAASNPPQDDDGDKAENDESNAEMSSKAPSKPLNLKSSQPSALDSPAMRSQTVPGTDSQYSLSNFVLHGRPHRDANTFSSIFGSTANRTDSTTRPSKNAESIRPALVSAIEEVLDDLETVFDTVSSTAKDHIHSE